MLIQYNIAVDRNRSVHVPPFIMLPAETLDLSRTGIISRQIHYLRAMDSDLLLLALLHDSPASILARGRHTRLRV
jgi:hypothetical protein